MKNKFQYILFSLLFVAFIGCSEDEGLETVDTGAPENLSIDFQIEQDNSGEVTIYPSAENANSFVIDYGDGSEVSESIATGENIMHTYAEGSYNVILTAMSLSGETTSVTQALEVSFRAPENLEVTITKDASDPFTVSVSAEADYAASFEVYFGDVTGETATLMMIGETVSHTYTNVGTYDITVIALSGGVESTTYTEQVTIVDPLLLPITFESSTVDYTFYNFGGGEGNGAPLVANPATNAVNSSQTVASYTKVSGSETWAGTITTLNEAIDFNTSTLIAVDVYSPTAGTPILLKVEDSADSNNSAEIEVNTTTSNEWETLVFDLSAVDTSISYESIILFFNMNTSGTGETYYFDNIRLDNPTIVELPLTFEGTSSAYAWMNFGGATSTVVSNPDQSGINTSANVTELVKSSGAETWAGSNIILANAIDLSSSQTVSMKVWSSVANTPVLLKLETSDENNTYSMEIQATTTVTNQWEELTFDFTGISTTEVIDVVTVFMNFGATGMGNSYYFDDIQL
ncbi:Carbohydrate binding domain-containing protein [Mesonia phycicola]|uniref:Carbohydrate binding domain-containing protein n=1 Tax=Mesonia phycicola TaxID=579105 RepID=A0A1M6G4Q7_9FLAO|nr:PKD domain-containing protein [Mesonia phycicola]SHJ04787.1 Carbohydrate binding domain-containing protein [Mesonia phycicola]